MLGRLVRPIWLSCALAMLAAAQSLDVTPAYHPEGPAAGHAETFYGDPFTVEAALPGLTHAQSQLVWFQSYNLLFAAAGVLPQGIPLGPGAVLWLDPAQLLVWKLFPPSLEISAALTPVAPVPGIDVHLQLACIAVGDFKLTTSAPLRLSLVEPPATWTSDEMRTIGAAAAGSSSVSFDAAQHDYHLRWQSGSEFADYVLDLDDANFSNGLIEVKELASGLRVLHDGGPWYRSGSGNTILPPGLFATAGTHVLSAHGITGNTAWFEWRDEMPKPSGGTAVHQRRQEFTLRGRSLQVRVRSLGGIAPGADNFWGFHMGGFTGISSALSSMVPKRVPYMDQIGLTLVDGQRFVSTYVDLFRSNATRHVTAVFTQLAGIGSNTELMLYERRSDGRVQPLDETGWVTVSGSARDCFVESSAPPSPWLPKLRDKIGVTLAADENAGGDYAKDLAKVQQLASFGFDDVHLFKQHWMRFGTNRRSTTHAPPNPQMGTEAEFKAALAAAGAQGWNVAVYTDMYSLDQAQGHDDNPNYSEVAGHQQNFEDASKVADLSYREGFQLAQDLGVPSTPYYYARILAPRRAIKHWERESKTFVDQYGTNASYFDIVCISAPDLIVTGVGSNIGGPISLDARSPSDQTIRGAIASYKSLFRHADVRTGGPCVGEGSFVGYDARFDTFYAGYLDGTYRTLSTGGSPYVQATSGQVQPLILDYEVNHVRERHCGIGLGQYTRFFYSGAPGNSYPLADIAVQEYRATEISYVHNGYFLTNSGTTSDGEYLRTAQQVKEYYTMRSLQGAWGNAKATIRYRNAASGSPWIDLDTGLKSGFDFVHPVVRLSFDNGLVIVVNHALANVQEGGYWIQTHGWSAINSATGYRNLSVLTGPNGDRYELVEAPNYRMADGNGVPFDAGAPLGTTTNLKVVRLDTGKVLIENPDGSVSVF